MDSIKQHFDPPWPQITYISGSFSQVLLWLVDEELLTFSSD